MLANAAFVSSFVQSGVFWNRVCVWERGILAFWISFDGPVSIGSSLFSAIANFVVWFVLISTGRDLNMKILWNLLKKNVLITFSIMFTQYSSKKIE